MSIHFSIIIPAYNSEKTIAQAVRAALAQDCAEDFEVIVVDDGSGDATAGIVKSFERVRYFYQKNSGPAAARNFGAREAKGEIIFFTDSDCIPHADWARYILPHFSDEKTAAVAGSYGIANPAGPLAVGVHQEIRYRHAKLLPRFIRAFGSYNVAIRRQVFCEAGGFSEGYRHASGEDNDLSYRILNTGRKIRFEPSALVDHFHPVEVRRYLWEQFRHGFWRARMYLDHPRMAKGDDYTFWKDALEVPLSLWLSAGAVFAVISVWTTGLFGNSDWTLENPLFGQSLFWLLVGTPAAVLFLLEVVFSFLILGFSRLVPFWAAVMTLRALARTAGFGLGAINFLPAKLSRK